MSETPGTRRIAIVPDDEQSGPLLLTATVEEAGLAPLAFDNGAAALEAALVNNIAIALLDVDMPGMDGYSVGSLDGTFSDMEPGERHAYFDRSAETTCAAA